MKNIIKKEIFIWIHLFSWLLIQCTSKHWESRRWIQSSAVLSFNLIMSCCPSFLFIYLQLMRLKPNRWCFSFLLWASNILFHLMASWSLKRRAEAQAINEMENVGLKGKERKRMTCRSSKEFLDELSNETQVMKAFQLVHKNSFWLILRSSLGCLP